MLEKLDSDLWVAEARHRLLGLHLGARMTVVRLGGGELWVHSPVRLDDALRSALDDLGPVKHVVAPNLYHHVYLGDFARAYPEAILHAPDGLAAKRRDLAFRGELGDAPDSAWSADLDQVAVAGMPRFNETVFLQCATNTLIAADLLFNLTRPLHHWTRLYTRLTGLTRECRVSRLVKLGVRDRMAARASMERILSWKFDRIIISHGAVFESGGPDLLREQYAWL